MITAEHLSVKRGSTLILKDLSFHVGKGQILGVLGGNGSGKTTLLKALVGGLPYESGTIRISGTDLTTMSYREKARRMAVLSQESNVAFDAIVKDAVMLGRYAHWKGLFSHTSETDEQIVFEAMEETKISHLADRTLTELSGGEKQRVWLARALVQQPECLFLDEPTNHLDLSHQVALMDHLKLLATTVDLTVMCILHDVNIASLYCDKVLLLKNGAIQKMGSTQKVLQTSELENLYGASFSSWQEPSTGCKQFAILPSWNKNVNDR